MDHPESTTLANVFAQLPDPRKRRGKRHGWTLIWTTICTALLSEQRTPHAIAHWIQLHADELLARLQPARRQVPSEATIRRALRQVDRSVLEQRLATFAQHLPEPSAPAVPAPATLPPHGLAIDGKAVRGAGKHGPCPHLVSLVRHRDARVLEQRAVAAKRHESSAVRPLVDGQDLRGTVVTLDAGLTQRPLAAQLLARGGDYLMVVKRNRPQLYDELAAFFHTPPLPCEEPWREAQTVGKGHGRLETRRVRCTADLDGYLEWPGVQQVVQRTTERLRVKTGEVSRAVTYALTSLEPAVGTPEVLEGLWRGHWRIENQVHYVRDVTMGEDAGQAHTGSTAQALAAVRNALLALLRRAGWTNIADALRTYAASIDAALQLIGALPARL